MLFRSKGRRNGGWEATWMDSAHAPGVIVEPGLTREARVGLLPSEQVTSMLSCGFLVRKQLELELSANKLFWRREKNHSEGHISAGFFHNSGNRTMTFRKLQGVYFFNIQHLFATCRLPLDHNSAMDSFGKKYCHKMESWLGEGRRARVYFKVSGNSREVCL